MTMNEYNDPDAAFDGIVNNSFQTNPQVTPGQTYTDPHPYGPPPAYHQAPVKTGLTPRGKVAVALAATVVAGGSLLGWQHYAAGQAANDLKAKELQVQQGQLELKKIQAMKEVNEAQDKKQKAADQQRQKLINSCVEADKGLIGKQMGVDYSSVMKDCQAQFSTTGTSADMQEAASASATGSDGSINNMVLVGGGALAITLIWGVNKFSRRPEPAPATYRPY
jgi:uncharacterized protein HemX